MLDTQVNPGFPLPFQRFHWGQITPGDLNIPQGAVSVVIAHGNDDEIGKANDNILALNAEIFIATITTNMANNAQPTTIYISACGQRGLATFAAKIALIAQNEQIWLGTEIYGQIDSIHGNVPGPNDNRWTAIYVGRRALNTLGDNPQWQVPGVASAILKNDQTILCEAFKLRNVEHDLPFLISFDALH